MLLTGTVPTEWTGRGEWVSLAWAVLDVTWPAGLLPSPLWALLSLNAPDLIWITLTRLPPTLGITETTSLIYHLGVLVREGPIKKETEASVFSLPLLSSRG